MDANFEKFENEKNERFNAVLHKYSIKSTETSLKRHIIYFPGDIQNYETIMKNDEATSIFSDFSFENTLELLSKHFDDQIFKDLVKYVKKKSFSKTFQNEMKWK